jgi:hypothetical protein
VRFLLCFVTGVAVGLLRSRVALAQAQAAAEEHTPIEITASASSAPEAPHWRARFHR